MEQLKTDITDYLSFSLDQELYAVGLNRVNKIIETPKIRRVPRAPELLEGVVNHMGKVLPVINFRKWLGLENPEDAANKNILVIDVDYGGGVLEVGLLVDEVNEVAKMDADQIEPAPNIGMKFNADFIKGVGKIDDNFIVIIDIEKLFSKEELDQLRSTEGGSDAKQSDTLSSLDFGSDIDKNAYLSFVVNNQKLAVEATKVIEILELPKLTKVPRAKDYMAGVVNLRGSVLPIIDTKRKFKMGVSELNTNTIVLVLEIMQSGEWKSVGAVVDDVNDIIKMEESDINPNPSIDLGFDAKFISGVAKMGEEFIQILNVDMVFAISNGEAEIK